MNSGNIEIDLLRFKDRLRLRHDSGQNFIYDPLRRKYFLRTPEEVVRQLLLHFLLEEKKIPANKIAIEKKLKVNNLYKRFDLLVFGRNFTPWLLVECKAPGISIDENTLLQAIWYNLALQAPYLLMTNGEVTYCCQVNQSDGSLIYLEEIPGW